MSQNVSFKLCEQDLLERLQDLLETDEDQVADALARIEEDDSGDLPDGNSSGEAYEALLNYLEMMKDFDPAQGNNFLDLTSFWMENRGLMNLIIFDESMAGQILPLLPEEDSETLADFLADDWAGLAESMGAVLHTLRDNLNHVNAGLSVVYLLD